MRWNDVKFGDFDEGLGTYSTMCVAADHEISDSYDDVVKTKYPTLIWGIWVRRNRHYLLDYMLLDL